MIKQVAQKDMTVNEFIDLVAKRYLVGNGCNMDAWINTLRLIAEEPAPNPFTDDQLAWMREEQRNGYNYAGFNCAGITFGEEVRLYEKKPMKDCTHWNQISGSNSKSAGKGSWLEKFLSASDPEPLCFADYAPLEEKK